MKKPFKLLIGAWLLAIHAVVVIALFQPHWLPNWGYRIGLLPPEPNAYIAERHAYLSARDTGAGPADVILIGDSHSELLDPAALPGSVRIMAAGGDTIGFIAQRIPDWSSLSQADTIILWAGYNDLQRREPDRITADLLKALNAIPPGPNIFLVSPIPVAKAQENRRVTALSDAYKKQCDNVPRCHWLDLRSALAQADGTLAPQFDYGDGIHLNRDGSAMVIAIMTDALSARREQMKSTNQ